MKLLNVKVKKLVILSVSLLSFNAFAAGSPAVERLLNSYSAEAIKPFSAKRGEQFWNRTYPGKNAEAKRSCTTCHSQNLKQTGKHVKTGKKIEAMALSVNKQRLQKTRKIEKWLKRNCKWTLGRECSVQEKGDLLLYLQKQ